MDLMRTKTAQKHTPAYRLLLKCLTRILYPRSPFSGHGKALVLAFYQAEIKYNRLQEITV